MGDSRERISMGGTRCGEERVRGLHCGPEWSQMCRRMQAHTRWQMDFLVAQSGTTTAKLRALWSYYRRDGLGGSGWDDLEFKPAALVSEFCVVRGASDDDKPMLERVAGDLVRAAESLSREELAMKGQYEGASGYVPVLVTNGPAVCVQDRLTICRPEIG